MDGHIVGSMISANSITGEQIQANSIKTANLELSAQQKIQNATDEETVKALIKADLDGFESTLSKEFITVENATTQIQQATEVAVKEATQSIIDNAVTESMGAVDGQLNDKLNQYTGNTLLPAIAEKAEEVLQNAENYVVMQLENYATKTELQSSISQTREQIELSVSETYTTKSESKQIITEAIDGITVGAINRVLGTGESKNFTFNGGANETWLPYKFSNDISDKEVYVSFNYTLTGTAENGTKVEFAPSYMKKTNNQTVYQPKHTFFTSDRYQDVNITDTVSFVTNDFQDISTLSTSYIRFVGNGFTGTLSISEFQIKPGNSKTSWSPAPEDSINEANDFTLIQLKEYYTKTETEAAIGLAKNEINLSVSETKETISLLNNELGILKMNTQETLNRLSSLEDDDNITPAKKSALLYEYNLAKTRYEAISKQYNEIDNSTLNNLYDNLTASYDGLTNVMNILLANPNETTEYNFQEINQLFESFYDNYEALFTQLQLLINTTVKENKSNIQQLAQSVEISLSKSETAIGKTELIGKHFKFSDEGWVEIYATKDGQEGQFKTQITDQKLAFSDGGTEVASISNKELNITDANIKNSLKIGKIKLVPSALEGIMMVWDE